MGKDTFSYAGTNVLGGGPGLLDVQQPAEFRCDMATLRNNAILETLGILVF